MLSKNPKIFLESVTTTQHDTQLLQIIIQRGTVIMLSINSLAPGRFESNFRWEISKFILVFGDLGISCEWICHQMNISRPTNDKSILVQVMAWCRQATRHYLSLYWPSSMSPYGVTMPKNPHNRHSTSSTLPSMFGWLNNMVDILLHF